MSAADRAILDRLLSRIDRCWTRFEETGDEIWMFAAIDTDASYRRAHSRLATPPH